MGVKYNKIVYDNTNTITYTQQYCGDAVFINNELQYVAMPDGRLTPKASGGYQYEYYLKDHLENIMVTFTDNNNDQVPEILTTDHYYPFGLTLPDLSYQASGTTNLLKYNGKEFQNDHDLNVYDYGARMYDPVIGRWGVPDPLAELYRRWSPYAYCVNNPLRFIDPDGMRVGLYKDKEGKIIGNDGKNDNKFYVVKTSDSYQEIYPEGTGGGNINGISEETEDNTIRTIINGTAEGCDFSGDVQNNVVELPTNSEMDCMVETTNKTTETQETGGIIVRDKSNINNPELNTIVEAPMGPPSASGEASINYNQAVKEASNAPSYGGVETTFHGHLTNSTYIQGPSQKDINNAKNTSGINGSNRYVFSPLNGIMYIYNGTGVNATIKYK